MTTQKIIGYRKLLNVTRDATLKELKTIYRNSMKEDHPDTIADPVERLAAEERSKNIIEAYHFLVSIAPETIAANLSEYVNTTTNSNIADIQYAVKRLRIDFTDGSAYEYFGVPENTYVKLINADSQGRFARRHIYTSFLYRNIAKSALVL